jgi:hypothetical protein
MSTRTAVSGHVQFFRGTTVGLLEGRAVGRELGLGLGCGVGSCEGDCEGLGTGRCEGANTGCAVGMKIGATVGSVLRQNLHLEGGVYLKKSGVKGDGKGGGELYEEHCMLRYSFQGGSRANAQR